MPEVSQQDIVPYSRAQMYQLVNQIDQYPQFIPWCQKTEVLYQDDHSMVASLTFDFQGITQSFTTRNTLEAPHQIVIALVHGPFKSLKGTWTFEAVMVDNKEHCRISLHMVYAFRSSLIAMVFEPAFAKISNMLIQSFKTQAAKIYD